MSAAESSPIFRQLITNHIVHSQYNFTEQTICLGLSGQENCHSTYTNGISTANLETVTGIVRFLRIFGHVVKKLDLSLCGLDATESIEIGRALNAVQLIDFTVRFVTNDFLQNMEHPFKTVTIINLIWSAATDRIQFGQLFPNINRIELVSHQSRDLSIINQHFKHLTHLNYGIFEYDQQYINDLMEKNPQITSVTVKESVDVGILMKIHDLLPNLEQLHIKSNSPDFYDQSVGTVQFDHINDFALSLERPGDDLHFPLILPQLATLHLEIASSIDNWINVIGQHTTLKRLTVLRSLLSYSQLMTIAETLEELEEITVGWDKRALGYGIDAFMQNNAAFKKVIVALSDAGDVNALQAVIPVEKWKIDGIRVVGGSAFVSFVALYQK